MNHERTGTTTLSYFTLPILFFAASVTSLVWLPADAVGQTPQELPAIDATGLPPRTTVTAPPDRPIPAWLKERVRIGHLPGYNDRMVKEFLKSGYNVLIINALAAWDRVGPAAEVYPENEVQTADAYLRKLVDTVHGGGAKALLYMGPVQSALHSERWAKAHPDWLKVEADGKPQSPPNFANLHSGHAEWVLRQLAYLTKTYKVDGFWFDGYAPVHLMSYDEKSRALFRQHSGGKEMPLPGQLDPVADPVAREFLRWHEQFFVDFADRMRQAIRQENPEAVIFANHSGNRTWYYPSYYMGEYPLAYSRAIDDSSIELYWDVPGDALYQQFCYAFMQAVTPGRAATVWIQPAAHGISGVASPIDIQLRGLEGAPWGVYPEFVESAGREEYQKLHAANVKSREEWWGDSEPVPYAGIVASEQTRTLFANAALPQYFSHTLGAFKAVFETHWPVRVLTEYDLEEADLKGIRVLVLPNVVCLSDRAAEVVRRFVRGGGGLVATAETSLSGADYARHADFALADLFQAKYVATHPITTRVENIYLETRSKHAIVADDQIRAKQATSWAGGDDPPPTEGTLALIATSTQVEALEGGDVLATYRLNKPAPDNKPHPAVIASNFGKGRVVYFAAGVDKGFFFYPDSWQRRLLTNAIEWAAAAPPAVEVQGPLVLAATVRRQPSKNRLVVHLLNDHSSYGRHSIYQKVAPLPKELQARYGFPDQSELRGTWPVREEVIPLSDLVVRCRVPGVVRATQQPENRTLELRKSETGVEVTVPKLEMHSMVVLEFKKGSDE